MGDESPAYNFRNNLSAFNQKHTAYGTFGGSGVMLESGTRVEITNSVFVFNDNYGVDNVKRSPNLILNNNVIAANAKADFVEFDIETSADYIEDEADLVDEASGNRSDLPKIEVPEKLVLVYIRRAKS